MLNITKPAANRIDVEFRGSLDANTMRVALDELFELVEDVENGVMLYTLEDFSIPTLGAIGVEFTYLPQLFGLISKIDKCAVLCDKSWIRVTAQIEGMLIPGLEIKSFELDQRDAAEAWLAQDAQVVA